MPASLSMLYDSSPSSISASGRGRCRAAGIRQGRSAYSSCGIAGGRRSTIRVAQRKSFVICSGKGVIERAVR
jgi:hypothetical protein